MGKIARAINIERCIGCDLCVLACSRAKHSQLSLHNSFVRVQEERRRFFVVIDSGRCDGCGACVKVCPRGCLNLE